MEKYVDAAREAAIAAGQKLKEMQGSAAVHIKPDKTRVTDADLASDKIIRETLAQHFPEIPYESEEYTSGAELASGLWWLADPLDGTDNFVMGNPHFCVAIALMDNNEPVAGVVHDPNLNETFYGASGIGAFLNGNPISCSQRKVLRECTVIMEFGRGRRQVEQAKKLIFEHLIYKIDRMRYYGAAAMDLCYIASGRLDAGIYNQLSVHDFAASTAILREAGGKLTDFAGEFNARSSEILAGSEFLHDELSKLVREFVAQNPDLKI